MNRGLYLALAFLVGCSYGWLGDGGHSLAGVLEYPATDRLWWPGLAYWVLPQFGLGAVGLACAVQQAMRRTLSQNPNYTLDPSFPSYALGAAAFAASLMTYLLSSLLHVLCWSSAQISLALLGCTLAIGSVLALGQDKPGPTLRTLAALALPVGIGGVAWESSLCAQGAFRYLHPDPALWVPHWIAQLWVAAVWSAVVPMWRFEFEYQQQSQSAASARTSNKGWNKQE